MGYMYRQEVKPMSSDGYSKTTFEILNRHSDNYQRNVGSEAVTSGRCACFTFEVVV